MRTTDADIQVCDAKKFYRNRSDAMKAKKGPAKRSGKVFSVYKCSACSGYHLTSQRSKGR